jgi:hypothetical protein
MTDERLDPSRASRNMGVFQELRNNVTELSSVQIFTPVVQVVT